MVTVALLLLSMLPGRSLVFGSGYPKDSTTEWCSKIPNADEDLYRCYPNPWGSGSTHFHIRFQEMSGIKGCLQGAANLGGRFTAGQWIFIGGAWGPFVPKLTLDQDRQCLQQTRLVNTATPGDSVELEFWFTPSDTVVSDTVRGTFKAWYRGDILPLVDESVRLRDPRHVVRWTRSGLLASQPFEGPVRLTDLRGRIRPVRVRSTAEGTLVVPSRPLAPGVYRLTWPQGGATVLVPQE